MPINTIECPKCSARINYVVSIENKTPHVTCRRCGESIQTTAAQIDKSTKAALEDLQAINDQDKAFEKFYTKIKTTPDEVENVLDRVHEVFQEAKESGSIGQLSDYIVGVDANFEAPDLEEQGSPSPNQKSTEATKKQQNQPAQASKSNRADSAASTGSTAFTATTTSAKSESSSSAQDTFYRLALSSVLMKKFTLDEEAANDIVDFTEYLAKHHGKNTSVYDDVRKYADEFGFTQGSIDGLMTVFKDREVAKLVKRKYNKVR